MNRAQIIAAVVLSLTAWFCVPVMKFVYDSLKEPRMVVPDYSPLPTPQPKNLEEWVAPEKVVPPTTPMAELLYQKFPLVP